MNNENEVEKELNKGIVKVFGGITRKFSSPGHPSVPDRIIMLPYGLEWKIEVKTTGNKPSHAQYRELKRYLELGVSCGWVEGFAGASLFVKSLRKEMPVGCYFHGSKMVSNIIGLHLIDEQLKNDI